MKRRHRKAQPPPRRSAATAAAVQPAPGFDPTQDYVSGGQRMPGAEARALGIEPLDQDHRQRFQTYERMLDDADIAAPLMILKNAVLNAPIQVLSRVDDDTAPDYARATELAAFGEWALSNLQTPLRRTLYQMLDSRVFGYKIAEQTWMPVTEGPYKGKTTVRSLKVKPVRNLAFVTDQFNNIVGFLYVGKNSPLVAAAQGVVDPQRLLPRSKCAVLNHNLMDEDPRGRSSLRPLVGDWIMRRQLKPEYLRHLQIFGGGFIVGETAPNAPDEERRDETTGELVLKDGKPVRISAVAYMNSQLRKLRQGGTIAVRNGAKINIIQAENDGEAYIKAFNWLTQRSVRALLGQTLAVLEGEHNARAAADTALRVLWMLIKSVKQDIEEMLQQDVLKPLLIENYGRAATELLPRVSLGDVEAKDVAALANAVAALGQINWWEEDQKDALNTMMNFPTSRRRQSGDSTGNAGTGEQNQGQGPGAAPQRA
jgi:hypothetical protein